MYRIIQVNQHFRNTFVSSPEDGGDVGLRKELFQNLQRQSALEDFIEFCRLESLNTWHCKYFHAPPMCNKWFSSTSRFVNKPKRYPPQTLKVKSEVSV
jgi:hypothetical protein